MHGVNKYSFKCPNQISRFKSTTIFNRKHAIINNKNNNSRIFWGFLQNGDVNRRSQIYMLAFLENVQGQGPGINSNQSKNVGKI